MDINAGELNQRITIYRRTEERNGAGYLDPPKDPEPVRRCWAKFTRISGTELLKADADMGQVKVRFVIRWSKTLIDRKMFVRYGQQDYEIEYVNDYGDSHQYIELVCKLTGTGGLS